MYLLDYSYTLVCCDEYCKPGTELGEVKKNIQLL